MDRDLRRHRRPIDHHDRRDEEHDYDSAREEWRLRRDKILFFVAVGIIISILVGAFITEFRDPYTISGLLAGAFGLLGAPAVLRADERSSRRRNGNE